MIKTTLSPKTKAGLIIFAFTNFFTAITSLHADPVKDFYIQQALDRYFTLPSDAHSLATGGSSDMTCSGAICTYLNPAGLGELGINEVSLSLSSHRVNGNEFITGDSIEQTESRGYVLLALPIGEIIAGKPQHGTISFGFSRYQGKTDDTISSTPDGHRRTVAYGYNVNSSINLGYTFTFYDDQLNSELADLHSHARILHLFGTQYHVSEDTEIGSVFKLGLGQSDTEDYVRRSDGLSQPREYAAEVGIAKQYGKLKPSVAFEYSYVKSEGSLQDVSPEVVIGSDEKGEFFSLKTGLEYAATEDFILRTGVRWFEAPDYKFDRSDLSQLSGSLRGFGWSGGFGYIFTRQENGAAGLELDYGFDYLSAADGQYEHRITLIAPFST